MFTAFIFNRGSTVRHAVPHLFIYTAYRRAFAAPPPVRPFFVGCKNMDGFIPVFWCGNE
jgi:hypothetical protein